MRFFSNTRSHVPVSALLHGLLLFLLLGTSRTWQSVRTRPPGSTRSAAIALTYSPGGTAAPTARVRRPLPVTSHAPALPSAAQQRAPLHAPPRTANNPGLSGTSPLGDGDISIALLRNDPDPAPDLSLLPPGTVGDVIIDVLIDAEGRITQMSLVRGVAPSVDRSVLATVQTWTYAPATRDGQPVASKQTLLFHYERG